MATISPLGAYPLPVGTDPNQVATILANLVLAMEKDVVLHYASAAARDAAEPSPRAGSIRWLNSPGIHVRYTGTYWVPLNYSVTYRSTPLAASPSLTTGQFEVVNGFTLPALAFPTKVDIKAGAPLTGQVTTSDVVYAYVNANGGGRINGARGDGFATPLNFTTQMDIPANTATQLRLYVSKESGTTNSNFTNDPALTFLIATVTANA